MGGVIIVIPDFQTLMFPLLRYLGDGKEYTLRETIEHLGDEFSLSKRERKLLLPSGQSKFDNRVGWAKTYLKKAGLLEQPRRGVMRITPSGMETLRSGIDRIDIAYLERYATFVDWRGSNQVVDRADESNERSQQTPEEVLEEAYQNIRAELAQELLVMVKSCSPSFFERLVVELLVKMGYGGSRRDAGEALGGTGDDGIDGIIKEDRLGLDIIYIQAKRWEGNVGRPEIQKFAGALQGFRAKKGVFLTTSDFTQEATEYVSRVDSKIVLINGEQLANLMIDFDLGVSTFAQYDLKRIDSDFFID